MNETRHEEAFSFIHTGNPNMYLIERDRYNILHPLLFLAEIDVLMLLQSSHKTVVKNAKGEVIAMNFEPSKKKTYDLTGVHEILTEVEESYKLKEKLLEDIDNALANGDKDLFMKLTEQLKEVS